MNDRGKWDGMLAIARFNWPFYAAATILLMLGIAGLATGGTLLIASIFVILGTSYFLFSSLGVSHWVYDKSDLYHFKWLDGIINRIQPEEIIFCHSGFDEASRKLRQKFPQAGWMVLDHYDPLVMTEASIRRARRLFPPTPGTIAASFDDWPAEDASRHLVFGMLAIHELRSDAERVGWFAAGRRCLVAGGRIILVEHVRDLANFVAFGPGFLHFHSIAAWKKSWQDAGLRLTETFRITPFVRVFVLEK